MIRLFILGGPYAIVIGLLAAVILVLSVKKTIDLFGRTGLGQEELVRGYTRGGAAQLRLDGEVGSLDVGKAADLVVLSEDLFTVDRYAIHRVEPTAVVMRGRVVHGRLP